MRETVKQEISRLKRYKGNARKQIRSLQKHLEAEREVSSLRAELVAQLRRERAYLQRQLNGARYPENGAGLAES